MRRGERPNVGNTMRPAGQRSATAAPTSVRMSIPQTLVEHLLLGDYEDPTDSVCLCGEKPTAEVLRSEREDQPEWIGRDESPGRTPVGALLRWHAQHVAKALGSDRYMTPNEAVDAGLAEWATGDQVPGAFCANCGRAVWQESGRWVHCDNGFDRCVVTYAAPRSVMPCEMDCEEPALPNRLIDLCEEHWAEFTAWRDQRDAELAAALPADPDRDGNARS